MRRRSLPAFVPTLPFANRHDASEDLAFGPLPALRLKRPVVLAISAGGVEIGYPFAYLDGGTLHFLRLGPDAPRVGEVASEVVSAASWGQLRIQGVAGRDVVLVDDGGAPIEDLVGAAWAARRGGPARLVVAAPSLTGEAERALAAGPADQVLALVTRSGSDATSLYLHEDPLPDDVIARMLADTREEGRPRRAIRLERLSDSSDPGGGRSEERGRGDRAGRVEVADSPKLV